MITGGVSLGLQKGFHTEHAAAPALGQTLVLGNLVTLEGGVTSAASAIEMYLGLCPGFLQKALA